MTSNDLADEITAAIERVRMRVITVGAKDYREDTNTQKFEDMLPSELLEMAIEEMDDIVAYAVMVSIQAERLRKELASLMDMDVCKSSIPPVDDEVAKLGRMGRLHP